MEPIYIPSLLRLPKQTESIDFNQAIPDLETLTPVHGRMEISHRGNYLEVSAKAETILTLTCNRCLQQFNYRLEIAPQELIWLDETADQSNRIVLDREVTSEDLIESLPPHGYFDPQTWLYEQLCLELPQQQLCSSTCPRIHPVASQPEPGCDRRWASLEALKNHLSN
jgi:uncharacterized protein